MAEIKLINPGLRPLPEDKRDFDFGAFYQTYAVEQPPKEDFIIEYPFEIKDQKDSDLCTAFAGAAVSEDQEGVELAPEYIFAKTKQITGEWASWGANLRDVCKALVQYGALTKSYCPYTLEREGRDFVADWANWSTDYDEQAYPLRKQSFFRVQNYDIFEEIRKAIWMHKDEKRSVLVGARWRPEWTEATGGVIPEEYRPGGFGHAFVIRGWKNIAGKLYLVAQLSNGTDIGDKGYFYFSKKVAAREFTFGAYTFRDIAPEIVKKELFTPWQRFLGQIKGYAKKWWQPLASERPHHLHWLIKEADELEENNNYL